MDLGIMNTETEIKTCLSCNRTIKGRSDKKFCDDYCRNNYNNQLRAPDNNYVRNVNNALRRNRRVLHELFREKEKIVKVTKERLILAGFQFKYLTHTYQNKKGNTYFFCYEYGYLALEGDSFLVVR